MKPFLIAACGRLSDDDFPCPFTNLHIQRITALRIQLVQHILSKNDTEAVPDSHELTLQFVALLSFSCGAGIDFFTSIFIHEFVHNELMLLQCASPFGRHR